MGLSMNAQTTVDSYTCEPAGAVKYISINENGNESEVYLDINGENNNDKVRLCFYVNDLEDFRNSLYSLSCKFTKWIAASDKEGVKDFDKSIGICFPMIAISWYADNKWQYDYEEDLDFRFKITNGSKPVLQMTNKAAAYDNQAIQQMYDITFSSPEDIVDLYNKLDVNYIKSKTTKE